MDTMHEHLATPQTGQSSERWRIVLGIGLVVLGMALLGITLFHLNVFGEFVLLGIGAIFIAWGYLAQEGGFMIPGGILSGLGAGVVLNALALQGQPETITSGVILLGLAAGFLAIVPLSHSVHQLQIWPWVPGVLLGAVGILVMLGDIGQNVLSAVADLWPLALVAVGVALLLQHQKRKRSSS
jgi:hypothetical protein